MRLPPWLWHFFASKRTKRALIIAPFALMVLSVCAYVAADYWGHAKYQRTIAGFKAEDLPLTLRDVFGPDAAPEDDVCQHPAVLAEMALSDSDQLQHFPLMEIDGIAESDDQTPLDPDCCIPFDIRQWSTDPAKSTGPVEPLAKEWLNTLQPQKLRFDALVSAFQRPAINLLQGDQINYTPTTVQFGIRRFGIDLALIQLGAGDAAGACQTLQSIASVDRSLLGKKPDWGVVNESTISLGECKNVIWQGIAGRCWNEQQLAAMQQAFANHQIQKAHSFALLYDFAKQVKASQQITANIHRVFEWKSTRDALGHAIKSYDHEAAWEQIARLWIHWRPPGLNDAFAANQLTLLRRDGLYSDGMLRSSYSYRDYIRFTTAPKCSQLELATIGLGLDYIASRSLDHVTSHDLLQCGIALERYRLKYGKQADKLEALVPEFLPSIPTDVCDGKPLRYQILPDGGVHVWSLWPSGKDEGGMPRGSDGNKVWTTGKIPKLTPASYRR